MNVLTPTVLPGEINYWDWVSGGESLFSAPIVGPPRINAGDLLRTQRERWAREDALARLAETPLANRIANIATTPASAGIDDAARATDAQAQAQGFQAAGISPVILIGIAIALFVFLKR